ncbi:MAG: flotillin-like protein FloA [Planctomycetota bacterium]
MSIVLVVGLIVAILVIFIVFLFLRYFRLWIQSVTTGAGIGLLDLVGMTLRKVKIETIVRARIMAVQSNVKITTRDLESHYLAGGNVPKVTRALISASRADIPMDFRRAAAIDLAGRDVEEAVQTSVNPKIIDVPDPTKGRTTIDAVAKDGIQLKARARVTVRTNIDQLIGGATEETIIARVGEGIVTTIGSSATYKDVMEHPQRISQHVLAAGLDAGSAFEILSIDIADIEVGENVGARLQADQAEADTRRARAEAEIRRARAVAREQEMIAKVEENRAKLVLSEAEVPKAISNAFRSGKIKEMLRLQNPSANADPMQPIG